MVKGVYCVIKRPRLQVPRPMEQAWHPTNATKFWGCESAEDTRISEGFRLLAWPRKFEPQVQGETLSERNS